MLEDLETQDILAICVEQSWCVQVRGPAKSGDQLRGWFREFVDLGAPKIQAYEIELSFPGKGRAEDVGTHRLSIREWRIRKELSQAKVRLAG